MNGMPGVNSTADVNVHSLALQIPIESAHAVHARRARATRPRHRRVDHRQPPAGRGSGNDGPQ